MEKNDSKPRPTSRMVANSGDPWVFISVMGEHVFDPRAGLVEYVSKREDTGEEGEPVQQRVSPLHTIAELKRAMKRYSMRILGLFGIEILILFISPIVSRWEMAQILLVVLGIVVFIFILNNFWYFLKFLCTYLVALLSFSQEPEIDSKEPEKINWWRLLQGGFEVTYPQEAMKDSRWRVGGKPWRILQKGDLRIPVMRKMGVEKLYRQHFARMAGYCHLIEKANPGVKSPYGIILFSPGYRGLTVPYNPSSKKAFHDGLVSTRRTLKGYTTRGIKPGPPSNTNLCSNCRHGYPIRDEDDEWYSDCGDLFNWTAYSARKLPPIPRQACH